MPTFDESFYSRIAVDMQSRVKSREASEADFEEVRICKFIVLLKIRLLKPHSTQIFVQQFFCFVKVIFKTEIPRYLVYLSETLFIVFENKLYGYTVLDEYSLISFHTIFAVESL